jgi:uncharacterized membrane protein YqgA involved in biofilm formation
MNKLDDMIAKALDAEERTLLAQYEERGLLGEFAGLFSGRLGFVNAMSAIAQTALFVGALYAAARFLAVGEVAAMLRWGGLSGLLMMAVGFIKLMQWEQIQANRIIREVKRVELLLARQKSGAESVNQ